MRDSNYSGFFKLPMEKRLEEVAEFASLTEEEKEIARRGRNLPIPIGRRSNQSEYRQATAFETLIGWWYLNDVERYEFIINIIDNIKIE